MGHDISKREPWGHEEYIITEDFDDNPLDILDDDGDDAIEMSLLFDKEGKGHKPGGANSGCAIVLLAAGSSFLATAWGLAAKFLV